MKLVSYLLEKVKKIQLKHIGYGLVILLIAGFSLQSYRLSVKRSELENSNVATSLLTEKINHKTDSIKLLSSQKIAMTYKSDSLSNVIRLLKKQKMELDKKLTDALTAIDLIPPDRNYIFLQDIAYPTLLYDGKLEYPFNGKQVTEIRKDFTRVDGLEKLNIDLENIIIQSEVQYSVQEGIISNQESQIGLYKDINTSCQTLVGMKDIEIKTLNKDIKKQKRMKYLLQSISIGEALAIIIILL